MLSYIIRRLLILFPTFIVTTVIIYGVVVWAPGNPLTVFESPDNPLSPLERQKLIERFGLDKPWYIQYAKWLQAVMIATDAIDPKTNEQWQVWSIQYLNIGGTAENPLLAIPYPSWKPFFGESFQYGQPVWELIKKRIWPTIQLSGLALILALLASIPIGTISALRQYSFLDNSITAFAFFGISMPNFWFGLILIYIFAVAMDVFPVSGMMDVPPICDRGDFICELGDRLHHLVLPVIVLATAQLAGFTRYMRSQVLEILRAEYVDTARAKGLRESVVVNKHILKNAIMPLVTLLGLSLPVFVSGALITEQVFGWPGIGQFFWEAAGIRDYPVIMGILSLVAIMTLLGNFLADLAYAMIDPRIRYD